MTTTDPLGHLGRETDTETGYALVCNATPDGNPDTDALCGKPATWHIRWEEATTENGFACNAHLDFALSFKPFQVHTTDNSACGMPGAWWVPDPSHCTMLALDEEPDRTGHATLELSRP